MKNKLPAKFSGSFYFHKDSKCVKEVCMEKTENSSRYLGEGNLLKLIIRFSIPCVLSLLVSALYNIVDQIFIGNSSLSTLGNAATGVVFPIFVIAQAFAWCFGDGCAAYLNICQGKNDSKSAHKAIGTGITITLLVSLVLMAVLIPFKTPILYFFSASDNTIELAETYFIIIMAFFPINMLANMINSIVRADGSPGWAMASMLAGAIVNIALDALFIFTFNLGMSGAAYATVIGQFVSLLISLFYLFRTKTFKLTLKSFIPDFKLFKSPLKLGISSFITQMTIVAVALAGNIMLAKYGALSKYGADIPIAVMGIQSKVFTVVINLAIGVVLGCQPIIGYNIGANKIDRVKKIYKYILIYTLGIGLVSTLLFELAPNAVISLFGNPTNIPNPDDYWEFATKMFRIFLSLVTFTCVIKSTSIFFQAVGKPLLAIIGSLIRDLVCFVPLIIILPIFLGIDGILLAAPISDLVGILVVGILTILFFKSLKKTQKAETDESTVIKQSVDGPIITISREHGSGGKEIGRLVALKLGIPYYYKEMTALAAKESGLCDQFIEDMAENKQGLIHSLYLSTTVIKDAIIAQREVITKIASYGSSVIVGRAADYILKDNKNVYRVFIHAPKDFRIKRIMEFYGDSYDDAQSNLKRSDESRRAYFNNISNMNWGDEKNYDLVLDSSIGIEESADLIVEKLKAVMGEGVSPILEKI